MHRASALRALDDLVAAAKDDSNASFMLVVLHEHGSRKVMLSPDAAQLLLELGKMTRMLERAVDDNANLVDVQQEVASWVQN